MKRLITFVIAMVGALFIALPAAAQTSGGNCGSSYYNGNYGNNCAYKTCSTGYYPNGYCYGGNNNANTAGNNMANGSSSNSCENSGYPAPYTGGAGVAKFFHLSDGSTVTITTTGAVIKQGRCGTPYREGWISTSGICNIQSAQDLNGRLSSGSSNPNGSTGFAGCTSTSGAQSSNGQPVASTVNIVNNNSQSQSQSNGGSGAQTTSSASSYAGNGTSYAHTHVLGAQTTASSSVSTLPNTGPGDIIGLSGLATVFGTVGHYLFARRRRGLV